jgi:spore coat polysaccharide biosynthesis protein SpsF
MSSVGVIIQARMGSSRLPGKVLRPIGEVPLLGHILGRLEGMRHRATVVVATSIHSVDDAVAAYCAGRDTPCFRGSELDVLERYYECAKQHAFAQIVRLTGDNPFTDIEELDRLIEMHLRDGNDYSHSIGELPIGVGAEILSFAALERSHLHGHEAHYREHVNEYILEHPKLFKSGRLDGVPPEKRGADLRLTVDTEDDYQRACRVAAHARGHWATTAEAIELCAR